ncbi:MAG: phosphoribosyltransferase [Planctomycetota bacterium]
MRYRDRTHAGKELAQRLESFSGREEGIVLALPRGGVPVAYEVATALDLPLDVFLVRKLGVPGHEELAFGAIASGGGRVLNERIVQTLGLTEEVIERVTAAETTELERRAHAYRGERAPPEVTGKTAILVDDGLATGATMRAAVQALRALDAGEVVVAVPTAAPDAVAALEQEADRVVAVQAPEGFGGVGAWYEDFRQTPDEEVVRLLAAAGDETATRNEEADR